MSGWGWLFNSSSNLAGFHTARTWVPPGQTRLDIQLRLGYGTVSVRHVHPAFAVGSSNKSWDVQSKHKGTLFTVVLHDAGERHTPAIISWGSCLFSHVEAPPCVWRRGSHIVLGPPHSSTVPISGKEHFEGAKWEDGILFFPPHHHFLSVSDLPLLQQGKGILGVLRCSVWEGWGEPCVQERD